MQPHVHARPRTHVSVIDVKCFNIIKPQHVKCKQNGGWAKYCAFVLENTERRKPKKCGKLSKACQETTLQILPMQMSCIICIVVDAQWAPSLPWVWSESRSPSPSSGRSWWLPCACHCTSPKSGRLCELKRIPGRDWLTAIIVLLTVLLDGRQKFTTHTYLKIYPCFPTAVGGLSYHFNYLESYQVWEFRPW